MAGASFGDVAAPLFVAGAILGDVGPSHFPAGSIVDKGWRTDTSQFGHRTG